MTKRQQFKWSFVGREWLSLRILPASIRTAHAQDRPSVGGKASFLSRSSPTNKGNETHCRPFQYSTIPSFQHSILP